MNRPARESQAHRMDAAADAIRHRLLTERVEQVPVRDAERYPGNQQHRQEAEVPAGVSDNGGPRRRCASAASRHGRSGGVAAYLDRHDIDLPGALRVGFRFSTRPPWTSLAA